MFEYAQTPQNLTSMGSCLYELIQSAGIVFYPDDGIRLAMSRATAVESERGFKITKAKASHKVDVVVDLAMAAIAAVEGSSREVISTWEIPGVITQPRADIGAGEASETMQAWKRTQGYCRAPDGGLGRAL